MIDRIDAYYDTLAREVPDDVKESVTGIAMDAFAKVRTELGDTAELTQEWYTGYMERYCAELGERVAKTQRKAVAEILERDDIAADVLARKLFRGTEKRGETLARNEVAFASNAALAAGYRKAGYNSVWRSNPSCCPACLALNGQELHGGFRPPLHLGYSCSVAAGTRYKNDDLTDRGMSRIMHLTTVDGLTVTAPSKHLLERAKERDVSEDDIVDALTKAIKIYPDRLEQDGKISRRYIGERATVLLNPETGVAATTWKTGKRVIKKLAEEEKGEQ